MAGEERKLVSVLFVDIVGSTSRAHGADPEDVRDVLRRFHAPVRQEIELHGGVVEKFIGDAVVAVFGARRAHGDDAARAVRCGLKIVGAVEQLNRDDPALNLAIRVGVATGEALVELGSDVRGGDAIAIGEVMNTAARLQAAAPEGGVAVGAETERATRRLVLYEPLGAVNAKGIPEPLAAWRAVGLAEPGAADAPFVGRDAELALLRGAFSRARETGRPQFVTVLGPPGIGKTRLTAEFTGWVRAEGGVAFRGRCLGYAERRAYQATVDQIRDAAGIDATDDPRAARRKLEVLITRCLGAAEAAGLTRPLSVLLALGLDEPVDAAQQLHFAARRLLEGLAGERPTVLVYEDLQWADESQFEQLDYLRDRLGHARAVILVLARPELAEIRPAWTEHAVVLEPLADTAAGELAATLLGTQEDGGALTGLVRTAGGNPLFVEELAASIRAGVEFQRLPVTVREAIAAHIDGVGDEERGLLLDASVVGETFWAGVLAALGGRGLAETTRGLARLVAAGLVRSADEIRDDGDGQFSFKHALVQEVAYGTLTRAARRERHRTVAMYVEGNQPGPRRELAEFLAHQWRGAGESEKAIDYLLQAAETARDVFASKAAIAHFDSALGLAGDSAELRRSIRLRQALALVRLGDYPPAAELLDDLIPELSGRDEVEAVLARVVCAYWMEETEPALALAARARTLARRLGDPELLAVSALYEGMPHEYTGDLDRIREAYDEARRLWVPGTRRLEWAALNEYDADARYWAGEYRHAEQLASMAHDLGGETHQLHALLRGGGWRGLCVAAQGRSEEALAWLDEIYRLAQELDPRWGAATLNYASLPLRDMLQFAEARARNERALEMVSARGAWGMAELQAEIDLCLLDLAEGNPGRVQRDFAKLWGAAVDGRAWRPWLGGMRLALVRAELARQTEPAEEAARHAADAVARARKGGRPKYEAAAGALLGTALVRLGRPDEGLSELRSAVEGADRLGSPGPRWQLRLELAASLELLGRDAEAGSVTGSAAQIIGEYAASLSDANAQRFLAAEPVRSVVAAGG